MNKRQRKKLAKKAVAMADLLMRDPEFVAEFVALYTRNTALLDAALWDAFPAARREGP